jgi:hypothetical protein
MVIILQIPVHFASAIWIRPGGVVWECQRDKGHRVILFLIVNLDNDWFWWCVHFNGSSAMAFVIDGSLAWLVWLRGTRDTPWYERGMDCMMACDLYEGRNWTKIIDPSPSLGIPVGVPRLSIVFLSWYLFNVLTFYHYYFVLSIWHSEPSIWYYIVNVKHSRALSSLDLRTEGKFLYSYYIHSYLLACSFIIIISRLNHSINPNRLWVPRLTLKCPSPWPNQTWQFPSWDMLNWNNYKADCVGFMRFDGNISRAEW